jgi:hypothetical protein
MTSYNKSHVRSTPRYKKARFTRDKVFSMPLSELDKFIADGHMAETRYLYV